MECHECNQGTSIFKQFIDKFDIVDTHRQMRCIKEELCEFMFEYAYPENKNYGSRREMEELADLVITCRVFAEMRGHDLPKEIKRKMEINMGKTGKDETGKVK